MLCEIDYIMSTQSNNNGKGRNGRSPSPGKCRKGRSPSPGKGRNGRNGRSPSPGRNGYAIFGRWKGASNDSTLPCKKTTFELVKSGVVDKVMKRKERFMNGPTPSSNIGSEALVFEWTNTMTGLEREILEEMREDLAAQGGPLASLTSNDLFGFIARRIVAIALEQLARKQAAQAAAPVQVWE